MGFGLSDFYLSLSLVSVLSGTGTGTVIFITESPIASCIVSWPKKTPYLGGWSVVGSLDTRWGALLLTGRIVGTWTVIGIGKG